MKWDLITVLGVTVAVLMAIAVAIMAVEIVMYGDPMCPGATG